MPMRVNTRQSESCVLAREMKVTGSRRVHELIPRHPKIRRSSASDLSALPASMSMNQQLSEEFSQSE